MARRKKGAPQNAAASKSGEAAAAASKRKKKGRRKASRTNRAAIKLRENMKAACDYRKQGYTFAEIAEEMKVSITTAYRWVSEAIKEIPEEAANDVRTIMLGRLDFLMSKTFELLGQVFEPGLVDVVLKLDDRRARLLGLYKSEGSPADRVIEAMGQRMAEMMKMDAPVLRIEAGTPIPANPIL